MDEDLIKERVGHVVMGADAVLDRPEIGLALPLAAVYRGVEFDGAAE